MLVVYDLIEDPLRSKERCFLQVPRNQPEQSESHRASDGGQDDPEAGEEADDRHHLHKGSRRRLQR